MFANINQPKYSSNHTTLTVGLNEQEVLKNVSAVLLTVPIGDYGNPFNALNGKIFGWEIFAQFKFWPK